MGPTTFLLITCVLTASVHGDMRPEPDGPIVQLFEWRFDDIANECVNFLQRKGYGGVQVSPVNENIVIHGRPWYERYQPLSYIIASRSGNETEFAEMVKTCNSVGVKIYVDVVLNHMAASHTDHDEGTGGSYANTKGKTFPAVPYTSENFHPSCGIDNWRDAHQVRYCDLVGLQDLDQSQPHVRTVMINYLNKLLSLGVAGFRVDAVKHMEPADVHFIFSSTNDVSPEAGFVPGARPYVFQEFFGVDDGDLKTGDYYKTGAITDFKYAVEVCRPFRHDNKLKWYKTFGKSWGLIDEDHALVFVDNHDAQRGEYGSTILTYKDSPAYKMAVAFMLAWPYGQPAVMSSFDFKEFNQGPPANSDETIQRVQFCGDVCTNGWVCEHRWRQIANMVTFRKVVGKEPVDHWWDNDDYQIAFSRGNRGFIMFNNERQIIDMKIQTGLPKGVYCDVISGNRIDNYCTGKTITVESDGSAQIYLPPIDHKEDGILAIHVDAKL